MKIFKKANGKVAIRTDKKEWLRIGQQLGIDTSGLGGGTGGMGEAPGAGSGAGAGLEDVNSSPDLSGAGDGLDDSVVSPEGDDLGSSGEEPVQKIRRLVGELQSALDELDGGSDTSGLDDIGGGDEFDTNVDDTSGLGDGSADLNNINPADQAL